MSRSWHGKPHAMADCLECGAKGWHLPDVPLSQAAWGKAHIKKNPSHTVHVVTERTTVIKGDLT